MPPIMAFHMGSLGFLTPFEMDNFESQINYVLQGKNTIHFWPRIACNNNTLTLLGHAALTLRSRLRCIVMSKGSKGVPSTNQLVLNEVVIDRGPSPYLSNIDLYLDGKLITSVQVSFISTSW